MTVHHIVRTTDADVFADHYSVFHTDEEAAAYAAEHADQRGFIRTEDRFVADFECCTERPGVEGTGGTGFYTVEKGTFIRHAGEYVPVSCQ